MGKKILVWVVLIAIAALALIRVANDLSGGRIAYLRPVEILKISDFRSG